MGKERLVYLMEVAEKLTLRAYFNSPAYEKKIPDLTKSECIYLAGDNIYRAKHPAGPFSEDFDQLENPFHKEEHKQRDLSGKFVLASNRFFYFGGEAVEIPLDLRPSIPKGQSAHGSLTRDEDLVQRFIRHIISEYGVGVHAPPHSWPSGDSSWKKQ